MPNETNPNNKTDSGNPNSGNSKNAINAVYEKLFRGKSAAWTAVFTGILTVFTYFLYRVSDLANETARTSQRAFVTFSGTTGTKVTDPDGKQIIGIQFFSGWENGGSTPTRNALTHCSWQPWSPDLPEQFDFPDMPPLEKRPFVIGPKTTTPVPMFVPISVFDDAKNGRKRLFIWGWATYQDVFRGSPKRLSEFCTEVINVRSTKPDITDPTGDITWQMATCRQHNCYDQDCPDL